MSPVPAPNARKTTFKVGDRLPDEVNGRQYRIRGFIGRGGMGEVYLAESDGSGELVAVKTIPLALIEDEKTRARTQLEMTALSRLRHTNVVPVYASGILDGVVFMVMELLVGATLQDLRTTHGRIPILWSLEILRDACRGLHAVHPFAVHRDIKPANIHFGIDAVTRVIDLGAAKWRYSGQRLTSTGSQLGTLAYMAPEQLDESAPIDAQTDIWGIGAVLYELLSNRHPFDFDGALPVSGYLLGTRIIEDPHTPLVEAAPLVPEYIRFIVDQALEKEPRKRFRSALEMAMVIDAAMERFSSENKGATPPLKQLASRLFPDGLQRFPSGLVLPIDPARRPARTTVPISEPRQSQPTAMPYLPTEKVQSRQSDAPSRTSDVFTDARARNSRAGTFEAPSSQALRAAREEQLARQSGLPQEPRESSSPAPATPLPQVITVRGSRANAWRRARVAAVIAAVVASAAVLGGVWLVGFPGQAADDTTAADTSVPATQPPAASGDPAAAPPLPADPSSTASAPPASASTKRPSRQAPRPPAPGPAARRPPGGRLRVDN
jgi:serine/threonine protein kinase